MKGKFKQSEKKPEPPTLGLAVVADLWLLGALLLFAPNQLDIISGWQILFYVLGGVALVISFGGALIELGKLWKTEALSYWGVGIFLLIPAGALYIVVGRQLITGALGVTAKVFALVLTVIGGGMFFHGIPYLFWKQDSKTKQPPSDSTDTPVTSYEKKAKRKGNFEAIASIIVAMLSLATAAVTIVWKLSP